MGWEIGNRKYKFLNRDKILEQNEVKFSRKKSLKGAYTRKILLVYPMNKVTKKRVCHSFL